MNQILWLQIAALLAPLRLELLGACQIVLCGIALDAAAEIGDALHSFMLGPLIWLVVTALTLETLHRYHRRKYGQLVKLWHHIERLRGDADLSALFRLMVAKESSRIEVDVWESVLSNSISITSATPTSAPRAGAQEP